MERLFDIVTFDCYGTLIDWETGIASAFLSTIPGLHRDEILHAYAAIEPVVEHERYRSYREVLTETATRVAQALGRPLRDGAFLAESLPSWRPFADTNAALEHLHAAGYRLGILSNTDDDLIAATRRHFTVDFELVITAQQVRSYKPGHAHFLAARQRIGDARWLHAAQSDYHDIIPTNELGIPNAWINRRDERPLPGGMPGMELRDLTALAEAIT